jgi:hypothetical protein
MQRVQAGAEISVGQPKEPLAQAVELALRDVVQAHSDIAFAYVPVIQFGDEPPSQVLVVFLRASSDPETVLGELSPAVKAAVDKTIVDNPGLQVQALAILPVSLGRPLDGLAQAVMITQTMLHVTDVQSWHKAKNPKSWLKRAFDWLMGR